MNDTHLDDEILSPLDVYPEAHQEVFDRARTEEEATDIFRRHGVSDRDADLFARLTLAYGRDRLKALPAKSGQNPAATPGT